MVQDSAIKIFYDGQCPFCHKYVELIRLKKSVSEPNIIDLRKQSAHKEFFLSKGFNLDQGMVVQIEDQYYHGASAVNVLANLSSSSGLFNRFNKVLLSNKFLAWVIYPLMVFFRNSVIGLLGHTKLTEDNVRDRDLDVFAVFALVWAIYTAMHFFYLIFYSLGTNQTTQGVNTYSYLMLALALIVYWKPFEFRAFALLAIVQFIEMWSQMPIASNHAIIQFFLNLAMVLTGVIALAKGLKWGDYFRLWAPVGRWLLLIMYFYGIFHKINADFLNPESSCAVAMWLDYPFPDFIGKAAWAHYMAIYGTFIIEGAVAIALLFRKTRYFAIIAGLMFHGFIGFSDYAFYGAFSFLSFALHMFFIPQSTLENFRSSSIGLFVHKWSNFYMALPFMFLILGLGASYARSLNGLIAVFIIVFLPLLFFMIIFAKEKDRECYSGRYMKLAFVPAVVVIVFFVNCAMPYMGLKTHQALTMFSNLHLEGGRSNHLVFQDTPSLFAYLNDPVSVKKIQQVEFLDHKFDVPEFALIYHDFLAFVSDHKNYNMLYTYERNGILYEDVEYRDLKDEIDSIVLPKIFRRYFFFAGVDYRQPRPCLDFK